MLSEPDGVPALRRRPDLATWSALEYAAHVRDVVLNQHGRVYDVLVLDRPELLPIHRDERVELGGYNDEDPATTATEVTIAADLFGRVAQRISSAQWLRPCICVTSDPLERDLSWVAQDTTHEVFHHLGDIDRVFESVRFS